MLVKNISARLITINEPLDTVKDKDGKVLTATGGAKYQLLPAGDAVQVPDSLCKTRYVKALIDADQIVVSEDTGKTGDDGEFDVDNMTKAELVDFAKENKIEIDPSAKKANVLAAIKEAVGD